MLTTLGVIEELHCNITPISDGIPNLVHSATVSVWPLQEAAIAAENLLASVLRQLQELIRSENLGTKSF